MTLTQIKKFENQKNISINVYCIEKQKELSILSIRLTEKKMDKHVNLLYVQNDDDVGHFVWIKKSISPCELTTQ